MFEDELWDGRLDFQDPNLLRKLSFDHDWNVGRILKDAAVVISLSPHVIRTNLNLFVQDHSSIPSTRRLLTDRLWGAPFRETNETETSWKNDKSCQNLGRNRKFSKFEFHLVMKTGHETKERFTTVSQYSITISQRKWKGTYRHANP